MREFLCDFMKWHKCKRTTNYGINETGYCIHCGRELIKFSKGNWVELRNRRRYFRR